MAAQAEELTPTPQMVGNAFVQQYYNTLSQTPEIVHRFYQNSSVISRPDSDGLLSSASTLDDIEKMILSLEYKNCGVQILTTDAQESFGDGVIVLVTGFFTGKDNIRRKFTQLFFLAPQKSPAAYFVLNDVFRYVDEEEATSITGNDADDTAPIAPLTPDPEPTLVSNNSVPDHSTVSLDEDTVQAKEPSHPLDNGKISAAEEVDSTHSVNTSLNDGSAVSAGTVHGDAHQVSDTTAASNVQQDAPKKSYASVANALNYKKQPFQQRALPPKPVEQLRATVTVAPEASSLAASSKSIEKNISPVKGCSIFVANLPMNATVEQLIETFEKFGPIKPNGVQVRSYKQERNCFGFVEFESASSMQSALKVSSLKIGDRMAHIEEKKANNEGGKFPPKKGFRGDNFRSRGNFGGGRGYGRNEYDNQGGLSGQSRSTARRNGDANQKVYQNESGRGARQGQGQGQAHGEIKAEAEAEAEGGKN